MDDIVSGRYRLEEPIGIGGMAEVWRAVDTRTGSTVAVKRLHPGVAADPAARARFRREIDAARAVVHPAAVRILDAGIDDGAPWLVMEHVAGGSLADRLATGVELPPVDGARIGADVAGALSALHAAGIVHRDVTPSNILLPLDGGALLADFGIARTWDGSAVEDVTRTGDLVGTLRFVAPEVLAGEPAGPPADVWALGAVLYEAVSGRRPFDASSPTALLESQRTVPSMDGMDPALAPLLDRMLEPEPAGRPAATDVESALTGIAGPVPAADDRAIPDEGTVVMATAVPSRAAAAAIEPVAIGAIAPAAPAVPADVAGPVAPRAPARPAQPSLRPDRARATHKGRPPAPAILAVGLLLLAAVALGASTFDPPTSSGVASEPPARTVVATPPPSATPAPEEQDGNAAAGDKATNDKGQGKDKGKGNGNASGNGKGKGNGNGKGGGD